MKQLHIMDKLSLAIIVLNVISAISFFVPAGTLWSSLLIGFIFYSIFIMWLSIPIGINQHCQKNEKLKSYMDKPFNDCSFSFKYSVI